MGLPIIEAKNVPVFLAQKVCRKNNKILTKLLLNSQKHFGSLQQLFLHMEIFEAGYAQKHGK